MGLGIEIWDGGLGIKDWDRGLGIEIVGWDLRLGLGIRVGDWYWAL